MTADAQTDLVDEIVAQDAAAKVAAMEEARKVQFLHSLMGTVDGRQYVWDTLEEQGLHDGDERIDAAYRWDTHKVAHASGARSHAVTAWRRLRGECPLLLAQMVTEAMTRLVIERQKQ